MAAFTTLILVTYAYHVLSPSEKKVDNLYILIVIGLPTICLAIVRKLAKLKVSFAQTFGATLFGSYTLAIVMVSFVGDFVPQDQITNLHHLSLLTIIPLFLYGSFFNMQVILDSIIRCICFISTILSLSYKECHIEGN